MYLLHVKNLPIFEQLKLEEALLRLDQRNFCLINEGSPPAIVLGISGKLEQLVDREKVRTHNIPLIRRFSGGGTVIVDESTLFISFICQKELHNFPLFPEPILKWSEELYKEVFSHPLFSLCENDYVFGEKKCGGNAQYLKKERFLHHTSFLWDYQEELMDFLLHPPKTPTYRAGRRHAEFLARMKDFAPSKEALIARLKETLDQRYGIQEVTWQELIELQQQPYRRSTEQISPFFVR